ncbi:Metallo-dependent phosphatase-like protein [Limtongia smithiae]|uniref:Metallo-dependent phosphatase-like protein n=1 Tax=Limtongia smithiae TaxID=1125753 RepID=UPI0034CF7E3A
MLFLLRPSLAVAAFVAGIAAQIDIPGSIPVNKVEPLQHRLAYAGTTGMTVSWSTYEEISDPKVYYGTDIWDLSSYAVGSSETYSSSLTWANHVKITGLEPATTYYYVVSNTNCYNCSEVVPYTFTTARPAGDITPYTAAVVIDMGVMGPYGESVASDSPHITAQDSNTMQSLSRYVEGFDLLLHPGDLAYADTWLTEALNGYIDVNISIDDSYKIYNFLLNSYYDELQPVTSLKPYMVAPGNHESNCDEGGQTKDNVTYTLDLCVEGQRNFTGYINHFRMPSTESGGVGNFWYSFDHGMVHYVAINTETDLGNGLIGEDDIDGPEDMDSGPFGSYQNEQIDWLEKDLAAVNRSLTPWIIVMGHRPWYASASNVSSTICWNCKKAFEPLLLKYNVDMVFYGHIHMYERNAPVANGIADPNELNNPSAPWYILNGCGGHYHGLSSYTLPLNPYSRYLQNDTFGWSKLTFHNCTHVTHEFIASANGSVLDSATLYKDHQCGVIYPSLNSSSLSSSNTSFDANSTAPVQTDHNAAGVLQMPTALFMVALMVFGLAIML